MSKKREKNLFNFVTNLILISAGFKTSHKSNELFSKLHIKNMATALPKPLCQSSAEFKI